MTSVKPPPQAAPPLSATNHGRERLPEAEVEKVRREQQAIWDQREGHIIKHTPKESEQLMLGENPFYQQLSNATSAAEGTYKSTKLVEKREQRGVPQENTDNEAIKSDNSSDGGTSPSDGGNNEAKTSDVEDNTADQKEGDAVSSSNTAVDSYLTPPTLLDSKPLILMHPLTRGSSLLNRRTKQNLLLLIPLLDSLQKKEIRRSVHPRMRVRMRSNLKPSISHQVDSDMIIRRQLTSSSKPQL